MRDPENIRAVTSLPIDLMGFIFYEKSPRYVRSTGVPLVPVHVQRVGVFVNAEFDFVLEKIKTHQLHYLQLHGDETPEYCRDIQAKIKASRTPTLKGEQTAFSLHSDEIKVIKAFRVNEDFDFSETKKYEKHCAYFLFDTKKSTNAVHPPTPSKGGDFSLREKLHTDANTPLEETRHQLLSPVLDGTQPLSLPLKGQSTSLSPPLEGAQGVEYGGTGKKFNWQILQQYTGNTPFLLSGGIGAEDVRAIQNFKHPKFVGIDLNSKFEREPALKNVEKIRDFLSVVIS